MLLLPLADRWSTSPPGAPVTVLSQPVTFQQAEVQFITPLALEPLVLHQMRLLTHAEPCRHSSRGHVASIDAGDDAVQGHVVESQVEDGVCRLRGISLTSEGWVEDVAQLTTAVFGAEPAQHHVADELTRGRRFRSQSQHIALSFQRRSRPGTLQ